MTAGMGFRWLTFQQEETPVELRPRIRDACHQHGLLCGPWEAVVDFGTPAHAADGFDFYIGQVEGDSQYARLVASVDAFRAAHPSMPAAVVTNTGGLNTPEKAKPLIEAGFGCIAEGHVKEDGVDPRQRADWCERVLGFPLAQPMAGLGAGATMADYPGLQAEPGWSVFTLERLIG